MKTIIAMLAGAMLVGGVATSADALSLRYSNNGSTWNEISDNSSTDIDPTVGNISFTTTTLSGFNNIWASGHTQSLANGAALFTNTLEVTGSAATLYLMMSDLPYNISMPNGSGAYAESILTLQKLSFYNANATANLKTYYGTYLFDTTSLISDLALANGGLASENGLLPDVTNPFSLTEVLTIEHLGNTTSQVTASMKLTPVPEPGTMLLLGAGFLGLAIYGKRRQHA